MGAYEVSQVGAQVGAHASTCGTAQAGSQAPDWAQETEAEPSRIAVVVATNTVITDFFIVDLAKGISLNIRRIDFFVVSC